MAAKKNSKWAKPKLIVLTRANSAESVLATCKFDGGNWIGNSLFTDGEIHCKSDRWSGCKKCSSVEYWPS
jgi:hypothetical protein